MCSKADIKLELAKEAANAPKQTFTAYTEPDCAEQQREGTYHVKSSASNIMQARLQ